MTEYDRGYGRDSWGGIMRGVPAASAEHMHLLAHGRRPYERAEVCQSYVISKKGGDANDNSR